MPREKTGNLHFAPLEEDRGRGNSGECVPCRGAPARCCGRANRSGLWRRPCSRRRHSRAARPPRRGRRARRPPGRRAAPSPPPGAPAAPPPAAAREKCRRRRRGGVGGGAAALATGQWNQIARRRASAAAAGFSMAFSFSVSLSTEEQLKRGFNVHQIYIEKVSKKNH